jgi:hypothetical protein
VAATAILAAAGAAAAILLRRREDNRTCGAPGEETEPGTGQLTAQDGQQRAGADGIDPAEDVRGKSTAT